MRDRAGVASCLERGFGCARDLSAAVRMYKQAADTDDTDAQY
jgi:TPR repeat protein